jgi:hypothetical protein
MLLTAVHAQPLVTLTVPVPPAAAMLMAVFETDDEQAWPGCVRVTDFPPMLSVADRLVRAVFAATVTATFEPPDPKEGVTAAQETGLLAFH